MSQVSYTASIPENMKNGQVVTWVIATDADEGENAEFEYILENCNKSFEIRQSGSIVVNDSTQLDIEQTQQFNCTVYAQESKTAERKNSSRSSLTISLTDVNDNNPGFVNKSYSFNVTDNPTEHTAIGQVNANDADVSNGYVTYELSGQKETFFKINKRTGELYPLNNPLYDCKRTTKLPKSVELAVTAQDKPEESGTQRRTTVSVTVNIQTNLCHPVLSVVGNNVSHHSVPEDVPPGSPLLTIQAFDADPDDSPLFFDISGDHEPFQLNKTSKNNMVQLSVSSALDRERNEHYSFTVQATDSKHVISWNFTFDITDINDNAPVFSKQNYRVNVTEEEKTQNNIITVQLFSIFMDTNLKVKFQFFDATDKDLTDNSKITYTLVSSKWSDKFTIDASSGALNLVKKIDADEMGSNKTLELVVIANDQGIPSLNSTTLIHVTVEDINDHAPVFSEAPQNLTFTFNETEKPQNFFTAKATDKDTDDKVFYKLTNATEAFHINKRTGQLSANRTLQRRDIGVVVIEAYNDRNYSKKTIQNPKLFIEINIKDINNNSPVFNSESYEETIRESSLAGSEIGSVKANDSDWSEEFGSVYYWITDGNSEDHFLINELNGTLYLANPTDYEKKTNYTLTITASDSRGLSQTITNHSTTASFVINILDVNDNSPKFTQDLYQCSVKESTLDFNCQVKAEDKDVTTEFKQIDYQLVTGSNSKFQITSDGKITLNQTMDYDAGDHSFILTVKATDRNDSSLASTCNVMITVNNTNDEEPEFQQREYKFSVRENQDSGTEVGVVRAMDKDSDSALLYSINPVNENFSVNSTSGIITTRKKFDYESKASYNFTVNVSDGNHTNTTSVYLEIRDMNDNAPTFNASVYKAYIPETDVNKVILKN
ncbi:protocadherin Fat 4-like, partial [Saccostrea cucullata]|uniref:protocadherin Fat 4-like n=1 Tax=Saccostrea cuccullata TaxID=36930 RepID=UPI002ED3D4F9